MQEARIDGNWELARDWMSSALPQKYKPHADVMPTERARNVLVEIALVEARVDLVQLHNFSEVLAAAAQARVLRASARAHLPHI